MRAGKDKGPIRVGVIGTGFGRRAHLPAYRAHPDFKPVAVLAVRPDRARDTAEAFDLEWHGTDLESFLGEAELNLVSVASQPARHFEQAKAALEAGMHILLEKPPAESAPQVEKLMRLASDRGLVAAIDFEFRNVPARCQALKLLDAGIIGDLRHIELRDFIEFWADPESGRPWGWQSIREAGGGVLGMLGSHHIDWFRVVAGDWVEVSGEVRTVVPRRKDALGEWHDCTADDYVAVRGRLSGGASAEIIVAACFHHRELTIRLFGSKGTLEIEGLGNGYGKERLSLRSASGARDEVGIDPDCRIEPRLPDWRGDLMLPLVDSLARAIKGEPADDLPTLEDAIAVQRVMDSIRSSMR